MKICLMSGAYVNAGDFLIEKRAKELLEANFPEAKVEIWKRDTNCDDRLDELNQFDLICFGGGPGFQKKMYPDTMPFVSNLAKLTVPYFVLGWGWKGLNNSIETVYRDYQFTNRMQEFLTGASAPLGVRDWYTQRMLTRMGYTAKMTGCPAWYDLSYMEKTEVSKLPPPNEITSVCISDAAFAKNYSYMQVLLVWARRYFTNAKITLVLHKPVPKEFDMIRTTCESMGVSIEDIAYSSEGFSLYDTCDIHIGFRVHAHIYSLSHRKISVLLNEDARGAGVNQALGLEDIYLPTTRVRNPHLLRFYPRYEQEVILQTESLVQRIVDTGAIEYVQAVGRMKCYYEEMKAFLQDVRKVPVT